MRSQRPRLSFSCYNQCTLLPMFYHRVLPPPPTVPAQCLPAAQVTGRDTVTVHRIMTVEEPQNAADKYNSPASSNKTSSSLSAPGDNSSQFPDQESHEDPTRVASPAHVTRKRSSSQLSQREPPPEQGLPPISTAIPRSEESLREVCLCQRDPKVPRPRNGTKFYCVL